MNTREGERILSRRKRGLREKKTKIHSEDLINIKKFKNWVWIFELSARSSSTTSCNFCPTSEQKNPNLQCFKIRLQTVPN